MSLPVHYRFLNASREKIGYCYSDYTSYDLPSDLEEVKQESVIALAKYIRLHLEGKITEDKIRQVAFVQIEDAPPS